MQTNTILIIVVSLVLGVMLLLVTSYFIRSRTKRAHEQDKQGETITSDGINKLVTFKQYDAARAYLVQAHFLEYLRNIENCGRSTLAPGKSRNEILEARTRRCKSYENRVFECLILFVMGEQSTDDHKKDVVELLGNRDEVGYKSAVMRLIQYASTKSEHEKLRVFSTYQDLESNIDSRIRPQSSQTLLETHTIVKELTEISKHKPEIQEQKFMDKVGQLRASNKWNEKKDAFIWISKQYDWDIGNARRQVVTN